MCVRLRGVVVALRRDEHEAQSDGPADGRGAIAPQSRQIASSGTVVLLNDEGRLVGRPFVKVIRCAVIARAWCGGWGASLRFTLAAPALHSAGANGYPTRGIVAPADDCTR